MDGSNTRCILSSWKCCQYEVCNLPDDAMSSSTDARFIIDGCDRARVALKPIILSEVEQEFADQLETASFWQRLRIKREIAREVERRLAEQAPSNALY